MKQHCKNCDYLLDAHLSVDEEDVQPQEGDYSVCFGCGAISTFDKDLNIEPLTAEQLLELYKDDDDLFLKLKNVSIEIRESKTVAIDDDTLKKLFGEDVEIRKIE